MTRFIQALLLCSLTLSFNAQAQVSVTEHLVKGKPVVVVQPETGGPFPVVYALSGLGEMVRGPRAAAHGWVEKYGLVPAMNAVMRGKLTSADFMGLVDGNLLVEYQERLSRKFSGLVIVCPAVPRKLSATFIRHLTNELIPWAEEKLPIIKGPGTRGIDGISLGGRHALQIALKHPQLFKSVGTEQASERGLGARWNKAWRTQPERFKHLHLNLLTSERDGYKKLIADFAQSLHDSPMRIRHQVTPGRHDKRFAKGPGALDMLLFHESVLHKSARAPSKPR